MKAHEKERNIQIIIVDDDQWEPDKDFKVQLLDEVSQEVLDGNDTECVVTILDEDRPGNIGFKEGEIEVRRKEASVLIELERYDGSDGNISCLATTVNDVDILPGKRQAIENKDFVPFVNQEVEFKSNVVSVRLEVMMPDCSISENNSQEEEEQDTVSFAIKIHDPSPEGVRLSRKVFCIINIEPDNTEEELKIQKEREQMIDYFVANKEISWGQQFKVACMLGPSVDSDNFLQDVEASEAILHLFGMAWKVIFATIPPRDYWGGWAAFVIALAEIGVVTTIVGELATVLGCTIGLRVQATAITLVAMGTSLPDTFASKTAAETSDYADSAIGNVTGSNCVNVFLGMGLPWVLGTVYWLVQFDAPYEQPAGSLAFSVMLFLVCALICLAILVARRICLGGELGGGGYARPFSALFCLCLWFVYIGVSFCQIYELFEVPESITGEAYYSCQYPKAYPLQGNVAPTYCPEAFPNYVNY